VAQFKAPLARLKVLGSKVTRVLVCKAIQRESGTLECPWLPCEPVIPEISLINYLQQAHRKFTNFLAYKIITFSLKFLAKLSER
jgi:hypothetical protein